MSKTTTRQIGDAGERAAAEYLESIGYAILARNYCAYEGGYRVGEIDVIASKGETVVFAEVKTRKQGAMTAGVEAVDLRKQRKLIRAAYAWLAETGCKLQPRFDVLEVTNMADGSRRIEHIGNAFGES